MSRFELSHELPRPDQRRAMQHQYIAKQCCTQAATDYHGMQANCAFTFLFLAGTQVMHQYFTSVDPLFLTTAAPAQLEYAALI